MLVDLLNLNLPASDGMAGLAGRAHLTLVNVGMAVGALVADVAEYHLRVASRAGDAFMQAAQRIASLIVVKLRNCANRLPTVHRVAVLAGEIQIAVWAPRALRRLRRAMSWRQQQQKP